MKVLSFILQSLARFTLIKILGGLCIVFSFVPEKWIAGIIKEPPLFLTEWWGRLSILLLGMTIVIVLFFIEKRGRNGTAKKGTILIYQDDEELILTEIAKRWSDSAHPKDGFSLEQVMTILVRAIWLGKITEQLKWNYERTQTQPVLRADETLPTNRASLAFVLGHFWDESLRFLIDPEKKCLSISGLDGNEPEEKFHDRIETEYEKMGTWKRLASLSYDQFRNKQSQNIFQPVYLDTICIKKNVFLRWLQNSAVRLPENWDK
jgi:hypothetical protein